MCYGARGRPALLFFNQLLCHQKTAHNSICNAILFHGLYARKTSPFDFTFQAEFPEVSEFWYWMKIDAEWHFAASAFGIAQCLQKLLGFIPIMTAVRKLRNFIVCFIEVKYSALRFCLNITALRVLRGKWVHFLFDLMNEWNQHCLHQKFVWRISVIGLG